MQFWIYDQSTNAQQRLDIDADPITIGRDEDCQIRLHSPFVARRHAKIFRKGNQHYVETLGRSDTRLANRDLRVGQPVKIDFGDELQIAQFAVAMVHPGQAKRFDTPGADARPQLQRKLMDFEQLIHSELLERMNLRATGRINKRDAAYVNQILTHLQEVLASRIGALAGEVIDHCVYTELHRRVVAEVVRQCQGRIQTDHHQADQSHVDPQNEQLLTEIVASVVDMMPLIFDPTSVTEDLAITEEAFDDQFHELLKEIPRDLRQYIVRRMVAKDIQDIMLGLGPLQDLLEMANVSEIMVVGKDRIYVEKNGVVQSTTRSFFSDDVLMSIIERIITPIGRRVDHSNPIVDARLADGSRVNVIIPPLSLNGPTLTIRKFSWIPFTIDDLIDRGSISAPCADFLKGCVAARLNIVISGGTGSGKTTLLNTMSAFARQGERIITIEESAELQLPQPHVVRLESRPANIEGKGAYTIRELVRNALRMRPDRLIIGEVRGPEALDMLQAMNTGHDGSLSTLHANAPPEALQRLETLVLMAIEMPMRAIREQIVAAVDVIVQISRFANGDRRVTHISEVTHLDDVTGNIRIEDIFRLREPSQPRLRHTGYIPTFGESMIARNLLDVGVFL